LRTQLSYAAAAALLFGLPLLWSLEVSIPFRVRHPLSTDSSAPLVAVDVPELAYLRMRDGTSTYRLRLVAVHPSQITRHPEIELRVADYDKTRTLLSAEFTLPSENCAYAARSGQTLPSNASLLFVRQQACVQEPNATEEEVLLTFRVNGPGGVALWTAGSGKPAESDAALLVADRTRSQFAGRAASGAVAYNDDSRSATRLALLTYVWQLSRMYLVMLLVCAVALAGLSAGLLADWYVRTEQTGSRLTWRPALAASSAALALAVVYACVVPPLQAADEPNHFVGLAYFLNRPQLAGESTRLGQLGHLDRIAFHSDEHFNPSDVGHPGGDILMAGGEADSGLRGRGVLAVWGAFGPLLGRTKTASGTLLLARVLNAVVFATAVGLFVSIVAAFSPSRWAILDAFPLFIIPTLPFFGMYVSNYAPLCAVYVLFAAAIIVFVWDDRASYVSGPVMGFSWAAAVLLSRSAFPLAPVLVTCAAARMILGPPFTTWSGALVFWMGLAVPSAIAFSMIPQHLFDAARATAAALPMGIRPFWELIEHPWFLVPLAVIASAVEIRFHRSWNYGDERSRKRLEGIIAIVGYAGAFLLAASIALSAFIEYPSAPTLDLRHLPSAGPYIRKTLLAAVTMFRFGHADFLTSQSFWTGYGWLDTRLPSWLVTTLAVSTGTALVLTLIWIARTRAYRTGVSLVLLIAGLLAAFATASFSVLRATPGDLHGRYLLGIYVCLITLCWLWLPRTIPTARQRAKATALVACGLCVIAVHGMAIATILSRYFG